MSAPRVARAELTSMATSASVWSITMAPPEEEHRAAVGRFDLLLDLEAREERDVVVVALDAVHHVGHDVRHELAGLLVDFVRIDEDFADFGLEVVADRTRPGSTLQR